MGCVGSVPKRAPAAIDNGPPQSDPLTSSQYVGNESSTSPKDNDGWVPEIDDNWRGGGEVGTPTDQ